MYTIGKKIVLPIIVISICAMTSHLQADPNGLNEGWYVGGSLGRSNLEPGIEGTNWGIEKENDLSKKLYVGKELNDRIGLEAFWTDLGVSSLKSSSGASGKVGYTGAGANITYKLPQMLGNFEPFAKLGVTRLKTENKEDIQRIQKNKTSVLAGVGVDYSISDNLQIRSEFDYYDKDVTDLNVGLKWKPGYRPHTHNRIEKPKPVAPKPIVKPRPAPKPKTIVRYVTKPAPKPKIVYVPKKVYVTKPAPRPVVKPKPKPQYRILHRSLTGGSNFATGSSTLTLSGQNALNTLVNDIRNKNINVKSIDIVGHTDSVGSHRANQVLSINRANSVARYLNSRGINQRLLRTFGRGETQPIANNKTSYGKARNRRVEIMINGTSRQVIRK